MNGQILVWAGQRWLLFAGKKKEKVVAKKKNAPNIKGVNVARLLRFGALLQPESYYFQKKIIKTL